MNRLYTQFQYSLEKKVVHLYARITIGATGAPTLVKALSKGIASVARTAAGAYTITLQDKYVELLHIDHALQLAAGAPAVLAGMVVRSEATAAATPTVAVEFLDAAGAGIDPDSGSVILLKLELKATTV